MEAKSYSIQFLIFEMLISHWWRLRFLLAVNPCDRTVNTFPKWYDTWKSAQKWGRESHFFNLVTFLTNTKKFKNPWLGAPGPFFGLFQWCQGMFLKVPEGFQRKKFSSCAETKLVPSMEKIAYLFIKLSTYLSISSQNLSTNFCCVSNMAWWWWLVLTSTKHLLVQLFTFI